ncbi:hypothetical protein L1276_000418 [Flavobacterium sp. HSC-32F16]|uniref:hypothetical protein n=1 Tax=Flavobacterium sp. HSC-32F16 TaxID=2910964 RepID=UPI0020A43F56|nr:hypothetical protein [Flavobacterium sp. HSC-32F16]MCP2025278.1 hypothetical protein [Flavobacterium sp. HSC-32F16]
MENLKITHRKSHCTISNTRMYTGENNELVCIKVYKGDWGHWDEKPETQRQENNDTNQEIFSDKNSDKEK